MEVFVNQIEKRSWLEIDLSVLRRNYDIYKRSLKRDARIMAVIKADGYGHGDAQVARMLQDIGVDLFAVSNIDEAIGLREAGIRGDILILGYTSPDFARILYVNRLIQAVVSSEYAEALAATGYKVRCQFAIDTGMNRIGLDADDAPACESVIRNYATHLDVCGLFTHLCVADTDDSDCRKFTLSQIEKFKEVFLRVKDLHLKYVHCCNSAAGLYYLDDSALFDGIGDIVRLGIVLYGLKPDYSNTIPRGIEPALSWMSQVAMVKTVQAGESIGYGRSYKADKQCRIATVTTGYADGLNRHLSNRGFFLINGHKAPIVGRICMDQTMVDVTDIPDVDMGTPVTILGSSNGVSYSADDMAKDLGTIGYEVICGISKRVQRFYTDSKSLKIFQ